MKFIIKKIENTLNRDIKEFNIILVSFLCIIFLVGVGLVSYNINSSYALFSDDISGEKTIEIEVSPPMSAARFLMKSSGRGGVREVVHEADDTLQIGNTEDLTEYRFVGSDDVVTNNYVYFNCSDIKNQNADTCELYRIIGVFPVDDGTGNIENRVKLIKAENYGNNYFDNDSIQVSNFDVDTNNNDLIARDDNYKFSKLVSYGDDASNGQSNWSESTLKTILNTTYYNNISGQYRDLIGDSKYYLGSTGSFVENIDNIYMFERKIEGTSYFVSGYPSYWNGKIGVMYVSDYGYACSCLNFLCNRNNAQNFDCWLFNDIEWLIAPQLGVTYIVYYVNSNGNIGVHNVDVSSGVRPVFYLTSDAEFVDGDGSIDNPYQLLK